MHEGKREERNLGGYLYNQSFNKRARIGLCEDGSYESAAPHKATCKTVKTHKKKERRGWTCSRVKSVEQLDFYCFISNSACFEDTINRCSFIDRTKGLVSRGRALFNGLIRDQAKLYKIMDLQQHGGLARPERI